jgi:hypothetical protein
MATSGAIMALRLTGNDVNSSQSDHQVECLSSRAREARNMTFTLRQKHLDVKLKIAGQPTWVSGEQRAKRLGSRERAPGLSLL